MKRLTLVVMILVFAITGKTQEYTLQQCIDSALANNITLKQSGLLAQSAEITLKQSRADLLPNVNADVYHGLNQGRSIDPSSNGYVDQQLGFANYDINAGVTVFNGGTLRNNIRQNATALEANRMETQQAKDNLVLNVIIAYLQVLNNEEQLRAAQNQEALSSKELERLEILNKQGAIPPSDYANMKGQLMNDQLAISNAKNALESSKLTLSQWMNKPYDPAMKLQRIDASEFVTPYGSTAAQVYQQASSEFAAIKAADLRKKSLEYALRSARGGYFPQVTLGGGFTTAYSSIAKNASGKIPYSGQLKNNISSSIGLGVRIPLFNGFRVKNNIRQADILLQNSTLQTEAARLLLQQQVDQAYLNMNNAYERYKLLLEQVNAYSESFKAAEVRYNAGVGTSYDYLVAKDRLDRANINLITARYDFVLRKRVLDYYGKK